MNRKIFWLLLVAAVFAAASCAQGTILFQDDFNRADGPPGAPWLDFTIGYYGGNPTSIVDGRLTATPVFNTCVDPATLILTDFCVTVDAKSYRAANLFLRIQNIPDVNRQRFLVCSLQPYWNDWAAPVIYFHEYYYGWGGAVGFVFIDPDIGPDIQMGATVIGSNLTFSITDGVKTYVTSHVIERAGLLNPGAVGVNCLGQGYNGPQSFDNFTVYDATGTGNATGTVTEAVSGAPVEGAVVDVVGTGISTTTGVDGTYSLTGLPLGGQKIRVRMFGYKSPPDILVHILPDQTATANAELTAINLDWARAASATASVDPTIAGNVNDADASTGWLAPSPGSWVQLDWDEALSISTVVVDNSGPTQDYTVQSSLDGSSWSEVKQVISAETGHSHWLEVIELPSPVTLKHLRVLVNSASYATGTIWSVECYKPKGNVIGVVKDSSGAPVSGADVYVYEAEDGKRGPSRLPIKGVTGVDGTYSIPTPEGRVMATAATMDSIAASSDAAEVLEGANTVIPDLVITTRALGSPAFSDNFDSVPDYSPDPLLDVYNGFAYGLGGQLEMVAEVPEVIAAVNAVSTRDSVTDVDIRETGSGIVARFLDANNFLVSRYSGGEMFSVQEVYQGQRQTGPETRVPINAMTGHIHLVVAGIKVQGFISDGFNTYWSESYTTSSFSGGARVGLWAQQVGDPMSYTGQHFDNLNVSSTPSPPPGVFHTPREAKAGGPGWSGNVKGIVTGIFPDYSEFAMEAEDRSSAIRVVVSSVGSLDVGDEVNVYGVIGSNGRLLAMPGDVTTTGRTVDLAPLGINNRDITGGGSQGVNNQDFLVAAWGRVVDSPAATADGSTMFDVTDGSTIAGMSVPPTFFIDNFDSGTRQAWWVDVAGTPGFEMGKLVYAGYGFAIVNRTLLNSLDTVVSVDAKSNKTVSFVLRYNPATNDWLEAIWYDWNAMLFYEVLGGVQGGQQNQKYPSFGPDIHLTASVIGSIVNLTITDGMETVSTQHVIQHPRFLQPGAVGVRAWGGGSTPDPQMLDNFQASSLDTPNGVGPVRVVIPPSVTDAPTIGIGDYVQVTGIASQPDTRGIRAVVIRQAADLQKLQ